jgi:hypothetical protein
LGSVSSESSKHSLAKSDSSLDLDEVIAQHGLQTQWSLDSLESNLRDQLNSPSHSSYKLDLSFLNLDRHLKPLKPLPGVAGPSARNGHLAKTGENPTSPTQTRRSARESVASAFSPRQPTSTLGAYLEAHWDELMVPDSQLRSKAARRRTTPAMQVRC